jgi:hypothetical protein
VELTDDDRERLHELRLRAFVTVADEAPERAHWQPLVDAGYATVAPGRVMVSPVGRAAADEHARATGDAADVAEAAYQSFVPINQRLLKVCHDWQLQRGGVPNDHTDADYDHKVIRRLHEVHARARRVLAVLAEPLPRFAAYEPRFTAALARLDAGDRKWFASPACDSYHTVWMQFHEDLLLATGHARTDEEAVQ